MDAMVGKTITKIEKSRCGEWLRLSVAKEEDSIYQACGDCCSSSWIETIELPTSLPQTVVEVDDDELGVEIKHEEHECLQVYKTVLRLASGESIHIEYRNSSNGYYGGSLEKMPRITGLPEMLTLMQARTRSMSPTVKRRILL